MVKCTPCMVQRVHEQTLSIWTISISQTVGSCKTRNFQLGGSKTQFQLNNISCINLNSNSLLNISPNNIMFVEQQNPDEWNLRQLTFFFWVCILFSQNLLLKPTRHNHIFGHKIGLTHILRRCHLTSVWSLGGRRVPLNRGRVSGEEEENEKDGSKIRRAAFLGSNSQERLRQWHRWELYGGLTRNSSN